MGGGYLSVPTKLAHALPPTLAFPPDGRSRPRSSALAIRSRARVTLVSRGGGHGSGRRVATHGADRRPAARGARGDGPRAMVVVACLARGRHLGVRRRLAPDGLDAGAERGSPLWYGGLRP